MKAFINARIYDFHTFRENSYVLFDEQIIEIGKMSDFTIKGIEQIDCEGQILMPSLVCGHSHIYSTFARGMNVEFHPQNFMEILTQLWWKMDYHITNDITYASGIVASVDFIKNGVTTLIDHHASKEIIGSLEQLKKAVCEDASLRGIFAFETSDRFNVEEAIQENIQFIQNEHSSFTQGLFGLHASLSLSDDTLLNVSKNLQNNPIHIHVAESKMDEQDSISNYGLRVINRLDQFKLIQKNSILVHALYVNDAELTIIKEREAVVALNISSNMNNGVGLPNYNALKEKGIKVIIGNDGLSSSMTLEYLYLYYSMHLKEESPLAFSLEDLRKIILDTYEFASNRFNIKMGKIEKGYVADLLTIPYIEPTPLNKDNVLSHLFFGLFPQFKPKNVFVAGKQVLTNYHVSPALEASYLLAKTKASKLWEEIKKEG
ncbi:MAG: amidohydrolase family protein [Firmicutes bacterium]|nr:amidohydrolase family protein [Bacillota bacterium]